MDEESVKAGEKDGTFHTESCGSKQAGFSFKVETATLQFGTEEAFQLCEGSSAAGHQQLP